MPKARCILLWGAGFPVAGVVEHFWLSFDAVRMFDALFLWLQMRGLLFVVLMLFFFARLYDGWFGFNYVTFFDCFLKINA